MKPAIRVQDTEDFKKQKKDRDDKKPKKTFEELNAQEKDALLKALAIRAGLVKVS